MNPRLKATKFKYAILAQPPVGTGPARGLPFRSRQLSPEMSQVKGFLSGSGPNFLLANSFLIGPGHIRETSKLANILIMEVAAVPKRHDQMHMFEVLAPDLW